SAEGRMEVFANGSVQYAVLEGAAHVRFDVTFFSAGGHHRCRDRTVAWPDQYDAWRLGEPVAETHASARVDAVRRHHYHHGDDLGDGPLEGKGLRRHFIGAARMYSTFSFFFLVFFFVAAE